MQVVIQAGDMGNLVGATRVWAGETLRHVEGLVDRRDGVSVLGNHLHGRAARAVLSFLGIAATGLLLSLALAFGWCVPGDCRWSHTIAWSFVTGAAACLVGVVLLGMPNRPMWVRAAAASVVLSGLAVGFVLWFLVV